MSALKIGSLFSGFGGLDMAVEEVFDARTAWGSDIDKGACKILAHRYPDVPNHGDITAIDWSAVEPVDIITGGFPCQDLSTAGKRAGMANGTRSGLWSYMCEAIDQLRPRLVVAENVRGLLSAEALRPVEPCPWCLGDEPSLDLRALGAVLADLADIGYDASWHGLRAADVGACHGRFRVFVVAYPRGEHGLKWRQSTPGQKVSGRSLGESSGRGRASADLKLLPTVNVKNNENRQSEGFGANLGEAIALLPTPAVNDMGAGKSVEAWEAWTDRMKSEHANGNGHGPSLSIEALRLLPTPQVADSMGGHASRSGDRSGELLLPGVVRLLPTPDASPEKYRLQGDSQQSRSLVALGAMGHDFGQYAPAVARWESIIGRPAPSPTEPTGKNGAHRLSPRFTEFMMGAPDGWITDVPGITRNEALKACGNGVVRQQAAYALRYLLSIGAIA